MTEGVLRSGPDDVNFYELTSDAEDQRTTVLRHGSLDVVGRLVDASNATLFCRVAHEGVEASCVYKPIAGERPLWDFPSGTLAFREFASYAVSQAAGWELVPTTLLRDGPFGTGMVQWWVDTDESVDLVALVRSDHPDLRRMALFDAVINNADRKGGHLLPLTDGRVLGIDHGVTFAEEYKLRTLLWQWEAEPIEDDLLAALESLAEQIDRDELGKSLMGLLDAAEVKALRRRLDRLVRKGRYPSPAQDWPAVPWPPF